jgi:protein AroM
MRKMGIVTIGQSPREDIMSVMQHYLPEGVEVLQRGALDNLDLTTITNMQPKLGERPLATTLQDGTEIAVTHENVSPLMGKALDDLASLGTELVVLTCTGGFEELKRDDMIVIDPGGLVQGVIRSLADGARLGVIQPHVGQVANGPDTNEFWGAAHVVMTHASPYAAPDIRQSQWTRAANELKEADVDYILLNCMGMDIGMKRIVHSVTGKPAILPSALVARVVDELMN